MTGGLRGRSLIRTAWVQRPGNNEEQVQHNAEGGDPNDHSGDSWLEPPQVEGKSGSEKQEGELEHEGKYLHENIEVPGDHPIQLSLTVVTAICDRTDHIPVQPLFSEHGEKRGEQRGTEARIQDTLHLYDRLRRAGPLWKLGDCVRGRVIDRTDEGLQDFDRLLSVIGLHVGLDAGDERGRDGRKKSSLYTESTKGGFSGWKRRFTKMRVVSRSSSYFFANSLSYS